MNELTLNNGITKMPRAAIDKKRKKYKKVLDQIEYNSTRYLNNKRGTWYFGENREKFKNVTQSKLDYLGRTLIANYGDYCPRGSDVCLCKGHRTDCVELIQKVVTMTDDDSEEEIIRKLDELSKWCKARITSLA